MPAKVALPDRTIETKVSLVAAIARPAGWWTGNAVKYDTTISLPSEVGLRPGMSADVEITIAKYDNVLSIPISAVVETAEGHYCWVEEGENSTRKKIELGDSNESFVVVKSGLDEGEEVVVNPIDALADAQKLVEPKRYHTIDQGEVVVDVTEQGTLESSKNTEIKCRVRGSSTINWVIESGLEVKKGEVLVKLENKQIEEFLFERTKYAHLSRDAAIGFRANATVAKIAIQEYLQGRYVTQLMNLEKDLALANQGLSTAKNMLQHSKMMFERGYVSKLDVEQREFNLRRAELTATFQKTQIDVLKKYTKEEQLAELRGNWKAAAAAANGHEEVLAMDDARIKLAKEEIKRCIIKAPKDGLIIYPRTKEWKRTPDVAEGATVQHDQVLLLMPDLKNMQVRVGVHETAADHVKPGMEAIITVVGHTLRGKVATIAKTAQPAGWWTGNVVKYDAVIKLPSVDGLKPGMSAEVNIVLSHHKDVVRIPIGAVREVEDKFYCYVKRGSQNERRVIVVSDANETHIVVKSGLTAGEQVLLSPPDEE